MTTAIPLAHADFMDFNFQNIDSVPGKLFEKPVPFAQKILEIFRRQVVRSCPSISSICASDLPPLSHTPLLLNFLDCH